MSHPDRELEALLRQALTEEAGRIEPAGDGLRRIRERTAARRRWDWSRWSTPALALAGAAAVIGAIAVLPKVVPDDGGPRVPGASGTSAPPATTSPPAPTASPSLVGGAHLSAPATSLLPTPPSPSPPVSPAAIPGAGVADMATIWPYQTRGMAYSQAERDMANGEVPDLTRPDRVAVAFVESYVGSDQDLTAVSAGAWEAGLRMEVRRGDAPVSLVYVVRARVGNDAPYVVVNAVALGSLTLRPPDSPGLLDPAVTARGTKHSAGQLDVQLRSPGADRPTAAVQKVVDSVDWTARLGRQPGSRVDAVAAWTSDDDGDVTAFAAAPVVAVG